MITLQDDERLVDAFDTHWIKYVVPVAAYVLMTAMGILLFVLAGISVHHYMWLSHWSFLAGLILLLGTHHWFFHRIMSESMVDIILTNRRIIFLYDRIFMSDDMHEVPLPHVRSVEARIHGLLQNILRYGSIWIDTGGTSIETNKVIPLVPHPHQKVKMIMELLHMK